MSFVYSHPFTGLANGLNTINAAGGGAGGIGGWVELGRTTLGSANATMSVSSLTDKRYYMVLSDFQNTTTVNNYFRLNSDSGTNYSKRLSENGGAEDTNTSFTAFNYLGSSDSGTNQFGVSYFANRSANEKLGIQHFVAEKTAGAGTAPNRLEGVGKWANTSNAINEISAVNLSNTLASGSELVILGWDPADTHTNNFWQELASVNATGSSTNISSGTISAKKYLWIQFYDENGVGGAMTFNNDSGSNYARRGSLNGATDFTVTSTTSMSVTVGGVNGFNNIFVINNASNEKLVISHGVDSSSAGAGTAPQRKEEVDKWTNTSNQITEIDFDAGANYGSKSILKVWGAN